MATSVDKVLRKRTSFTQGVYDNILDEATTEVLVGVTGTSADSREGLLESADAAVANQGTATHPDKSTLDIQTAEARHLSHENNVVFLEYRQGPAYVPRRHAIELAESIVGHHAFPSARREIGTTGTATVFDAFGRPDASDNDMQTNSDVIGVQRIIRRFKTRTVPIEHIHIPTVLDKDPRLDSGIQSLEASINGGTAALSGITTSGGTVGRVGLGTRVYQPWTLFFSGMRVKPVDTPQGIRWLVRYHIIYRPDQWHRDYIDVFQVRSISGTQTISAAARRAPVYPTVVFNDVLLYHDPDA